MKTKKTRFKTLLTMALAAMLLVSLLAGCSSAAPSSAVSPEPESAASVPEPSEPEATAAEKVLLSISFGTSYDETREKTIGAIESALQAAFPDYEVRRAFTSEIIKGILAEKGIEVDDVGEAMERLVADGVKEVIVQPTHVMNGFEYDDTIAEITPYAEKFDSFKVGQPLLISDQDYAEVADALVADNAAYNTDGTALVFMGHGTEHQANATYQKLQDVLVAAGHSNFFVGTVEAEPTLEEVMALVQASGASKVVLLPLMVVAGDHATNDMASDEEDSWKSAFAAAGYQVEAVLKGLGEYPAIQAIYVRHAQEVANPGESSGSDEEETLDTDGLTPISGSQVQDGTYAIEVASSSSMFKIVDCQLTVAAGEMTAVMTLSGTGYEKLYMGTGAEAEADSDDNCIYFVEDAEGAYTYEVPVEALDAGLDCAAFSIRKQAWYDRVVVFQSNLLPADSISV